MYRLRTATADDVDFLAGVVLTATRDQGRLAPDFDEGAFRERFTAWTTEQIAEPDGASTTYVVEVDGAPVGRLRVVRTSEVLELAGIQLLPDHQSRGTGTRIITDLLDEAATTGRAMTLSVERDNPRAYALYRRLGFVVADESATEYTLRHDGVRR